MPIVCFWNAEKFWAFFREIQRKFYRNLKFALSLLLVLQKKKFLRKFPNGSKQESKKTFMRRINSARPFLKNPLFLKTALKALSGRLNANCNLDPTKIPVLERPVSYSNV